MDIAQSIANELEVNTSQVMAAVTLLDEGATVPFISRYRKEVTDGLSDTQLRLLEQRLQYLRELEERRLVILKSIEEQEKLTPELKKEILAADNKTRLEDLYLPYKQKRRTKAQIAREAGLEPLALSLLNDPTQDPEKLASEYLNIEAKVETTTQALDGARQILMENMAEDAELLGRFRDYIWQHGVINSVVVKGKEQEGQKFTDYFEYSETIRSIPSHRVLALLRGRREGMLRVTLDLTEAEELQCQEMLATKHDIVNQHRAADAWLVETVRWTCRIKMFTKIDLDLMQQLREQAEEVAIQVFAKNLHDLLMAAPAGQKTIMGLDPGLRTGVKVAIVDITGKLLDHTTIFPHVPKNQWQQSIAILAAFAEKYNVNLVSIGNGTGSRETDRLVKELSQHFPKLKLQKIVVSEAGASVYSASELAAKEFPDLDVTFRGAVSIARRLQDPLAELVKIEPKAIGVGQYQHDLNQVRLKRGLDNVVEDCVNAVGVDANLASVQLLSRVAGLNQTLAENIVAYRDEHGMFTDRKTLLKVPRMGEKTFQQAAGFLRISNGSNALDASAVHPEAYPLVEKMLKNLSLDIKDVTGNREVLKKLSAEDFTDEKFGLPTVQDVIAELEKPGRDPRPEFVTATFKDGVEEIKDLREGMLLEGVITNVTNFGAFVDIGVHQDGLVHISALSNTFVKDPREVVKTGDIVKVKVMEVEVNRKRIALSMRLDDSVVPAAKKDSQKNNRQTMKDKPQSNKPSNHDANTGQNKQRNSAMADALAGLLSNTK